jgi:hypothetical protein
MEEKDRRTSGRMGLFLPDGSKKDATISEKWWTVFGRKLQNLSRVPWGIL